MAKSIEELADTIYDLVKEYTGRKKFTARELSKMMIERFEGECDLKTCKEAIRLLTESKRCVFTYAGTSYVELPDENA